jgi:hypothetical protein
LCVFLRPAGRKKTHKELNTIVERKPYSLNILVG